MEITGLNMKEAESFLHNLVTEIRAGSEVHIDLSEETRDIYDPRTPCYICQPTGKVTLTVSWKRNKAKKKSAINKKRLREIAAIVEEEMGYGGLRDEMYERFISDVVGRYIAEVA